MWCVSSLKVGGREGGRVGHGRSLDVSIGKGGVARLGPGVGCGAQAISRGVGMDG